MLGFDHPNTFPTTNWAFINGTRIDNVTCVEPWPLIDSNVNISDDVLTGAAEATSIMFSLTTARSLPCLTTDDLQGLNYLYPACEGAKQTEDELLCVKAKRNHGWLRFLMIVFVPVIYAFLVFSNQKAAAAAAGLTHEELAC